MPRIRTTHPFTFSYGGSFLPCFFGYLKGGGGGAKPP